MSVPVDWADVQLAGLPEDVLTTEVGALSETASCRLDGDGNVDTCLAKFSGHLSSASGPFVYVSTTEPDPPTEAYVGVDLVLE